MNSGVHRSAAAFTLAEVLSVLVVITVLAGAMGLALRSVGGSTALQPAQATLASLCGAARLHAALSGQNARLIVAADPADPGCYLRWLQVVGEDAAQPGGWRSEGSGIRLPPGVFVVPPPAVSVPGNPAWPANRRSTALPASAQAMAIDGADAGPHYYLQFTPRGTTGGGNLILTVGRAGGDDQPVLDNPDDVRGVLLRPSGAFTLINDAGAFAP